jgi:hypothetical protein
MDRIEIKINGYTYWYDHKEQWLYDSKEAKNGVTVESMTRNEQDQLRSFLRNLGMSDNIFAITK